ncbi:MAG: histidinol-phosphate transaminase [Gammaproteobacteria bacterium]|nr:histidinol-phosphate transaminase [Gammaproteobacteria bacterium]
MNRPDFRALLNPHLAELEEYAPIEPFEVLSARLEIPAERIVKLDANENPYGPLPAVTEALARYPYFHIYPDPAQSELRDALGEFIGVPAAHILPGHGADELLDCLCRMFLAPGDAVINTPPTFGMYSFDARLAGAKVVDVSRRDDFSVDVEAIAAAVEAHRPKLLFLTSPNNPSGHWLDGEAFERLLALPVAVVLDEAYVEFADHPSRAGRVLDCDNLMVLRTFSKAAGIAGLRLGYGVFPQWLMRELWKFKQPYNVNAAASVAGIASLRNAEQIEAVVEKLKAERSRLYSLLGTLRGIETVPGSQANFILCRVVRRDARDLKLALERTGVLVRYYDKPGLAGCIRISVGRPEHTDALIDALRDLT